MSKKILKHLNVKFSCSVCEKQLHNQKLLVSVAEDFKISELNTEIVANAPAVFCKNHATKKAAIKYTFYHEEKLKI